MVATTKDKQQARDLLKDLGIGITENRVYAIAEWLRKIVDEAVDHARDGDDA